MWIKIIPPVYKKLTKTMLTKGNPDCFKELKAFARLFGVDFSKKVELPLIFTDGTETVIRFYQVTGNGGRKDCRYNIPAAVLKQQAEVGDTIAFSFTHANDGRVMLVANVTRHKEYEHLTRDEIKWTDTGS